MDWLKKAGDEVVESHPKGKINVSSGVSPSGVYHLGTLREVLTAEALARELRSRGRECEHLHLVDDLDVFRKVPKGLDESFNEYLGKPLCDIPSPDGKAESYADYYLTDLHKASQLLNLDIKIIRANQKYRQGFFADAIERTLENIDEVKKILIDISGHKLSESWSPVQVNEDGYLKNRKFINIEKRTKKITYLDKNDEERQVAYDKGDVKLNWRIDWPARWWLMEVHAEPFGRDHATKGGSYDTGVVIAEKIFGTQAPLPLPYNFINRTGETKKMSKSAGDTITISELLKVMPPEIIWYFVCRYAPSKQLFFDAGPTLSRIIDEYSELAAKTNKSEFEDRLMNICQQGIDERTISNVPFSHLVASYQASLKDTDKTLEVIKRTEHGDTANTQKDIIENELQFIDNWLTKYAPEDMKFELKSSFDKSKFSAGQIQFLEDLAQKIEKAPKEADGEWFHKAIYEFKESHGSKPKELFTTLYNLLIDKDYGPRAGWFLSILPRDWLIKRLRLKE